MLENNNNKFADFSAHAYVEAYLIYQTITKTERRSNFAAFFANFEKLELTLANTTLFLELASAWQLSRCIDANHVIIKIFLPHAAVEGRSSGLTLRPGFLRRELVQNLLLGWEKAVAYVENPYFSAAVLRPQFATTSTDSTLTAVH